MTVGSPTVSASKVAARRSSSPDRAKVSPSSEVPTETWEEKLYAALPLFILGGACLAVAVDFYQSGATTPFAGSSSVRLAPWGLFLALAVTGFSAGIFALLLEDEEPTPAEPPVIARPPPSPSAPVWDESSVLPEKPAYVRPRTWEQHVLEPEDVVGWTPVEPRTERVSPDVVLVQIDEIAASLRKKTPPSRTS